jgi:DNA-binding winged helix-turn-helix (wHTH) protein
VGYVAVLQDHKPVNENFRQPLGLSAFESLRAENEPWLADRAYIPPPDFELMAGGRSIVVYGQPGSGKTALSRALEHRAQSSMSTRLVVRWRPSLPADVSLTGTPAARAQLDQVMNACAMALLESLVSFSSVYIQAPDWAQQTLAWFIQCYTSDNLDVQIAPLFGKVDNAGQVLLHKWTTRPTNNILAADAPVEIVIARLVEALSTIGISGIWVMADGAERLAEEEPERLAAALKAFLSNLAYFEQSPFFYKLTLPLSLEPKLRDASSVVRRRVFVHQLQWVPELLTQIVVRRIASAIGADNLDLIDLYAPENKKSKTKPKFHPIQSWLTNGGGDIPLDWLHFATPLAIAHLELRNQGQIRPLTREEWVAVRNRMPLRLVLDDSGQIRVSKRVIGRLPPTEQSVLRYLMKHEGQICSKEDLYKKAYLASGDSVEKDGTDHAKQISEPPALKQRMGARGVGYSDILDTVLWRLREAIEPDMDDPVFIQTYRGQGIMLQPRPFG